MPNLTLGQHCKEAVCPESSPSHLFIAWVHARDKGTLTPWSFKPPDSDKLQKGSWLKLVHSSSRTVAFNHFALFNQNLRQRLTHTTETKVLWNPYVSLLHIMRSDSFCSTQLCSISFEKRVWLTKLIAQSEVWKTSLQNWFFKREHTSGSPESFLKQSAAPTPREFHWCLGRGPRMCISTKFPGAAAGPGPHLDIPPS